MYRWLIFTHILAIFGFLLAHGAAAAVSFKLRGEREIERVRALLELSRGVTTVASVSMLVLLAAGITAGFMGNWWGQYWIWTSLSLFLLIGIAMMVLASRPFNRVRQLVQFGKPSSRAKPELQPSSGAAMDQQLAAMLAATHPVLLTAIGFGGFALILWLMMFKPF